MSHVDTIDVTIDDLKTLEAAAKRLGGTLKLNQKTYNWFGRHMGDYPLPKGFQKEEMGKCEHAISMPDCKYEVGVVKRRDGKKGFTLIYDFWAGGGGLEKQLGGRNLPALVQAHAIVKAKRAIKAMGYTPIEKKAKNGAVQVMYEYV